MSDLIGGNRGGFRSVSPDGLINESTGQQFPTKSTVMYEGKNWTVAGFDPVRRIYRLQFGELYIPVSEAA